jgi:hypothetical protein
MVWIALVGMSESDPVAYLVKVGKIMTDIINRRYAEDLVYVGLAQVCD